jgi:nucleoid-associated protein YgaU
MRKKILITLVTCMLSVPFVASASTVWYNPLTWFKKNKKINSTTVTGNVEYIIEGQVVFKTIDGQVILLIGKKAASVASVNNYIVRVFGNVYAPSDVYPRGAISVRNFRVLEEITQPMTEPVVEPVATEPTASYIEPEPYLEPEPITELVLEPEVELDDVQHPGAYDGPIVADDNDDEEALVEPSFDDFQKYVVQPGDSLGKISSKIFGTSSRWKEIAELNTINNPRALRVGMTLKIPVE